MPSSPATWIWSCSTCPCCVKSPWQNAKLLRHSEDPVVRSSVYINADLTKAEALTAYQRRCRRRELAAARISADNSSVSQTIPVLNTRVVPADQSTNHSVSVRVLPSLQSPVDEPSPAFIDQDTAEARRRHHQQQNRHDLQQSVDVSLSAGAAEFVPAAATDDDRGSGVPLPTTGTTGDSLRL